MITERQQKLINAVIETFIKTAEPVSSKYLGEFYFPDISSATIRNEMSGLEDLGLLAHFHTSGGRVPTDRAYRFYVDNLLVDDITPPKTIRLKIKEVLNSTELESRSINRAIAQLVAELSDNLAIANTLNSSGDDFFKVGLTSLFESPEFRELDRVFRITEVFEHFDKMFSQFEREIFGNLNPREAPNLRVFIGKENPIRNVHDETVILARYHLPHQQTGSLTVIGPMRMDYGKNLSLIKCVVEEINNKTNNYGRTKTKKA